MSRAEEFISAVQGDPELEARLSAATTSAEAQKVVADAGFADVSSADVQAVLEPDSDSDELSEHQMAAASGAGGFGIRSGSISDPGWGDDGNF
jgi:predicted ribosomally synthesized peptide with nif11-like leader